MKTSFTSPSAEVFRDWETTHVIECNYGHVFAIVGGDRDLRNLVKESALSSAERRGCPNRR
jgi:hypothetical protein